MDLATWLTVVSISVLGAMSPGPSLAVVLRHTLQGGRGAGMRAALAHGAGIAIYAFATISGLALLITASPGVFRAFEWAGAGYLAWLGVRGLMARPAADVPLAAADYHRSAARDGFLIAFLNPKVAVFFIALFSQVIGPDTPTLARAGYAVTTWVIDTGWYVSAALLFSTPRWLAALRRNAVWFERLFGVILLALAGRLLLEAL